jgi:hypothetical protein
MKIVKGAAVVVMSGFLMGASSLSTRAAMPAGNVAAAPSNASVIVAANGPLSATESLLKPPLALPSSPQVHSNCKASHLYGADDVVGDQNSCIMGGYAIPGAYGAGIAAAVR